MFAFEELMPEEEEGDWAAGEGIIDDDDGWIDLIWSDKCEIHWLSLLLLLLLCVFFFERIDAAVAEQLESSQKKILRITIKKETQRAFQQKTVK